MVRFYPLPPLLPHAPLWILYFSGTAPRPLPGRKKYSI
jgi:hypothetical protein